MKYFAETEKAVKLKIVVDYYNFEKTKSYFCWIPKTQLSENGVPGEWISSQKAADVNEFMLGGSLVEGWEDADGIFYKVEKTAKELEQEAAQEARFEAGCKAYEELLAKAKALGIKGVRVGMRKATIEAKIAAMA